MSFRNTYRRWPGFDTADPYLGGFLKVVDGVWSVAPVAGGGEAPYDITGALSDLQTTNKNTLVAAINEVLDLAFLGL